MSDYKGLIEELRFLSIHVPEYMCEDDEMDALEKSAIAIETLLAERDALYKIANDTLLRHGCVECEECIYSGLKEDEKPCLDCINTEGYCGWQWRGTGGSDGT